jgi:hydrogenase expression/formation protein HypC
MCLGIPGRIAAINEAGALRSGLVDFGGVTREVCFALVPEVDVGDHVLVHVGFAICRIDESEAARTLELLREIAADAPETS